MTPDENLFASKEGEQMINILSRRYGPQSVYKFNKIIDDLAKESLLINVVHKNTRYQFAFKNEQIKNLIWEGGSMLELHTYLEEAKDSYECRVGVHIDWDGIVHNQQGVDVLNEIDVISLRGYVPTFISCKSGKMNSQKTLHALYELDTVASRFGGKYAKKVLESAQSIGRVYVERAKEMGIEIR